MLSETVRISSVGSDYIRLQPVNSGTCSACELKPSCGQYLLNAFRAKRVMDFPAGLVCKEDIGLLKNDSHAQIHISEAKLIQMATFLYLLPLCSMLITAYVSMTLGLNELAIIVVTGLALAGSMAILNRYFRNHDRFENIKIKLLTTDESV